MAAEVWLGPMDVPIKQYAYVCWMASWGAAAAFLQKYASGEITKTWSNVMLHITKDAVNSTLAAVLTFMLCRHFNVPKALEAISYTLAGYGGARTLEWAYKKWISTAGGMISKQTGVPDVPDAPAVPPAVPPSGA